MNRLNFNSAPAALVCLIGLLACSVDRAAAEAEEAFFAEQRSSLTPLVPLEQGWDDPPREARTRCWWWWLNGNVTAEAITRDLEEMKAKGFGGANIIDAGGATQTGHDPVPHGPDFGSPEWRVLFLHALAEADRLGLEIGVNIVSGWNMGGPTVTPEQASKKLTWTWTTVDGGELGAAIDVQLEQPPTVGDYYRGVKVIAFPDPGEAPATIERFRPKAYHDYPGGSNANDAGWLLHPGGGSAASVVDPQSVRDISSAVDEQGRLQWHAPPGQWRVVRLGYTLSNSIVSTSSDGWNGWAIDYLDRHAFDKYWEDVVAPILDEAKPYLGKTLRYLQTDSWELGPVNWTPQLPAEFAKRRGYELDSMLPALAGYVVGDRATSNRFLADFRRTLAELIAENNYGAFAEHAHANGLGIHPESGGPHAAPIDALLCLSKSDVMMGEFWGQSPHRPTDDSRFFTKQPASAAHLYGRRTVLAEAFTTIGPHWEEGPRELKPVFDRAACEGLNLTMLHTFDCSPPEMGLPGQAYFAGTHINPNNTWWHASGPFFAYLNRCQFLLQQGLPANDVLYFYGENVPSFVRVKENDPARVLPGYDYDVTNADALISRTRVEAGRITLPDGTSYAALVLPACGNGYGLEALRHVATLVDGGATVIGEKPSTPIGLAGGAQAAAEFAALTERLWPQELAKDAAGQGGAAANRVIAGKPTREVLRQLGVSQDFEFLSPTGDQQVDFIHRRTSEGDLYFVANRLDRWETGKAMFRVTGRQPELWDPVSGERRDATAFTQNENEGRTVVPLMLPPHGSTFVLFRRPVAEEVASEAAPHERFYRSIMKIIGPWRVYFDPARGGTGEVTFGAPGSWTWRTEEGNKHYSGPVDYRITFEMPPGSVAAAKKAGRSFWLDLGEVKNIAEAELNGKPIGTVWTAPFRFNATPAMREGANELKVTVTNLWPNRLIGDAKLPPEQRITRTNIRKFKADSPLMLSGMLGPVQVLERE
ncbi:glycosyl hydrolase [Lacipirellula sp.]|uniref:glycosyl hydrolase n=1 Tax=Lacipirellula sp. TaxID=2691419 RepID=UPI003D0A7C57